MTQFAIIYLRSLLAALSHVFGMIFFRLKAPFSGLGVQSVNPPSFWNDFWTTSPKSISRNNSVFVFHVVFLTDLYRTKKLTSDNAIFAGFENDIPCFNTS